MVDWKDGKDPANDRLARALNWIGLCVGIGILWFVLKVGNI